MTAPGPVRVLLADDETMFRDAVRLALRDELDLTVVAEAGDGPAAAAAAAHVTADVAVVDAELPGCGSASPACVLAAASPRSRVVVLDDAGDLRRLVAAVECGAAAFLDRRRPLAELAAAIRAVHRGETLVPPAMLGGLLATLVGRQARQREAAWRYARLTRRERDVCALVAAGADTARIARQLVISRETARTHVQNILGKLGVHSRVEAAAYLAENDLLDRLAGAPGGNGDRQR